VTSSPSLNILLIDGGRERLLTAVNLAASALALGTVVRVFFTWEALRQLAEGTLDSAPLPAGCEAAAKVLADQPGLAESLQSLREGGLQLFACSNTVEMLGLDHAVLEQMTDGISGATAFLAMAEGGQILSL
jgi:peroxiredoxin family protein